MNQHISKDLNQSTTPARVKGVDPVLADPGTGTLQKLKGRYTQWGFCACPEQFLEKVVPPNCGITIISCPICQKEHGRVYS